MFLKQIAKPAVLVVVLIVTVSCWAQEQKQEHVQEQKQEQKTPPATQSNSVYRLEYVFSEIQNGKKVNSRAYTMVVRTGERGSIRLGSRVPVPTANQQYQYVDLGVNIDCRVEHDADAAVVLVTNSQVSSVPPDQPSENRNLPPIIRNTQIQAESIVPLEKRTLVGSADQVDGTGRFDLEVTATKLR
ncbi:MAG TPA: hypothetical protein VFU50_15890 [Terriglobales bacterium]|nr:hypothetical protein [Terriglobales bacterium]